MAFYYKRIYYRYITTCLPVYISFYITTYTTAYNIAFNIASYKISIRTKTDYIKLGFRRRLAY